MTWSFSPRGVNARLAIGKSKFLLALLALFLPSCAYALQGHVHHHRHHTSGDIHGGQQPIAGTHIYLFAIPTGQYGAAPISLLHGAGVTVDTFGHGYIVGGADGSFNISNLYASYCPTPNSSVYLQAIGGDPGDGQNNTAIDLVTALPLGCSQMPNAPEVNISELTTVAAASALGRYANLSFLGFSAGSSNPQPLINAVTNANNMVSGYTALVQGSAFSGSLTVPSIAINTLGSILAECVNNGSASPSCIQLFAYATPPGGAAPTDVFQAAVNIALNPASNVTSLFGLVPTASPAFDPTLSAAPATWALSYGMSSSTGASEDIVTIDHTKVANSDQVNIPIAVSILANSSFQSVLNGGNVQSPYGYDILFTSDAAGQNLLDFEIDNYNSTTGAGTFWVRIPYLSHTTDTVFYMWYGIPNISSSLENSLGVWSNNYLSVYHLGNGAILGITDSAIAGYDLSGTAAPVTGQIGGAAFFSGDPSQFLYHDNVPVYPSGSNPVTLEVWEKNALNSNMVGYGTINGTGARADLIDYGVGFGLDFGGPETGAYLGTPDPNWHQMVGVYGGADIELPSTAQYYDGQVIGLGYVDGTPNITNLELTIGGYPVVRGCCMLSGTLDEVHISSGTRSADWIATEYANQSSPATFLTILPLDSGPTPPAATTMFLGLSASPALVGNTVTLSITVSTATGLPAMGAVTCTIGTQSSNLLTLAQGGTTTTFVPGAAGLLAISCSFSPAGAFLATSGNISETILPNVIPVAISIASSKPQAAYGDNVIFTATITPAVTSSVAPIGVLTFYSNNVQIGQIPLPGLTFATSTLPAGSNVITVQYSGDGNYLPATSQPIRQGVSAPPAACKIN